MQAQRSKPVIGDQINFEGVECDIKVDVVPAQQPLGAVGIFVIQDQYGETHLCEPGERDWIIVRPEMLTPGQADLLR